MKRLFFCLLCARAVPGGRWRGRGLAQLHCTSGGWVFCSPLYVLIIGVIIIQVADCTVDFSYVYMLCYIVLNSIRQSAARSQLVSARQSFIIKLLGLSCNLH